MIKQYYHKCIRDNIIYDNIIYDNIIYDKNYL